MKRLILNELGKAAPGTRRLEFRHPCNLKSKLLDVVDRIIFRKVYLYQMPRIWGHGDCSPSKAIYDMPSLAAFALLNPVEAGQKPAISKR